MPLLSDITMEKRQISVFDFDGTLTTKDTLFEFIKFAKGTGAFWWGMFCVSPVLVAYVLRLYPNGKAKERLFSHFFRGMSYDLFRNLGQEFASRVESFQRHDVVQTLQQCQTQGHQVYVISASIEEWVRPWCEQHGVTDVLATRVEVNDGLLTGRFSTPNCYGQEKVNRLLAVEPDRQSYLLHAYGDSRGDRELMSLADKGVWINK